MKIRLRMGVYGLLVGLIALFLAPVASEAYTAKGITNSKGLVYDDVYGVSNGAAIMRKGDHIDLVDSLGNLLLDTVSGVDTHISNSVYGAGYHFDKGLVPLSYGNDQQKSQNCGYYDINKKKIVANAEAGDVTGEFSQDATLFAKAMVQNQSTMVTLYNTNSGTKLSSSVMPVSCEKCYFKFGSDNTCLNVNYCTREEGSENVAWSQGYFEINDGVLGEFVADESPSSSNYYQTGFDRNGIAFLVRYISGSSTADGHGSRVEIEYKGAVKHLYDCSSFKIVGEFVFVQKNDQSGWKEIYSCNGDRAEWIESLFSNNSDALYLNTEGFDSFDGSRRYVYFDTKTSKSVLFDADGSVIKDKLVPGFSDNSNAYLCPAYDGSSSSGYDSAPAIAITSNDAKSGDWVVRPLNLDGDILYEDHCSKNDCGDMVSYWVYPSYLDGFISIHKFNESSSAKPTTFIDLAHKKTVGTLDSYAFMQLCGGKLIAGEMSPSSPVYLLTSNGLDRFMIGTNAVSVCMQNVESSRSYISPGSLYHSSCAAWWAKDNNGKWGLIKTDGTVIVPFEYDAYEDLDFENENLVLVKKDGLWWFFDTSEKTEQGSEGNIKFADVDSSTPHSEDIHWLANSGISEGWLEQNGSRTFRGMDSVKRQDMAAFLYRLAGSPELVAPATSPFIDVTSSTPHYKEICWLAQTGISTGWKVSSGYEFRGMDSVKRQDMAAFLKRLSDYLHKGGVASRSNPFSDVNESTPHYEEVLWLSENGVSEGWAEANGSRTFRGMSDVVRQDMAAFLHRMDANGLV